MADEDSWLHSVEEIEKRLRKIARSQLGHAVSLVVSKELCDATGNLSVKPKGCHKMDIATLVDAFSEKAEAERQRVTTTLDDASVRQLVEDSYQKFENLLDAPGDAWKMKFPGKCVLLPFCGEAGVKENHLKNLYIQKSF